MVLGSLIRRKDFLSLSRSPNKAIASGLILQMAAWPKQGYEWENLPEKYCKKGIPECRVGYTASKKVGNAVARNRAKRRLREAVRIVFSELADDLPIQQCDYVIIARQAVLERNFEQILKDMKWALRKVIRLQQKKTAHSQHMQQQNTGLKLSDTSDSQRSGSKVAGQ